MTCQIQNMCVHFYSKWIINGIWKKREQKFKYIPKVCNANCDTKQQVALTSEKAYRISVKIIFFGVYYHRTRKIRLNYLKEKNTNYISR